MTRFAKQKESLTVAYITRKHLPRRTFLRGMGVTLALPLLDAMVPALTAQSKTAAAPRLRFGAVYVPNGVIMEQWTPTPTAPAFAYPPILKSLEPFRAQAVVLSNLARSGG